MNAHVGVGSMTFSSSQGNLAAWKEQESKEQILLTLPAQFSVAGLFFTTDNLTLKSPSPLQANHTSLHWWCCSLCLEKADGGLKSSIHLQPNSLFPWRKAHGDVDEFGKSGCCAALLEVDIGAHADRLYWHSLQLVCCTQKPQKTEMKLHAPCLQVECALIPLCLCSCSLLYTEEGCAETLVPWA